MYHREGPWTGGKEGVLPDRQNRLAVHEKGVEGAEKYRNGKKDALGRKGGAGGIPILYKQFKTGSRDVPKSRAGPLERREHALAFGCNISGRCKPDN